MIAYKVISFCLCIRSYVLHQDKYVRKKLSPVTKDKSLVKVSYAFWKSHNKSKSYDKSQKVTKQSQKVIFEIKKSLVHLFWSDLPLVELDISPF